MSFWNAFNVWRNKESAKVGDTVIKVQCNGCMASDHVFEWAGEITGFEAGTSHMSGYNFAVVKVLKKGALDHRDVDLGIERVVVEDGSFQRLGTNLLGWFK
jgi:hypothetical protein